MRKTTYQLVMLMSVTFLFSCGDNKNDGKIDMEEEIVELHQKQMLTEQERNDYFITIPVFKPSTLVNDEIADLDGNFFLTRTYLAEKVKLADIFDFYKKELPKSGWRIDDERTKTEPNIEIRATDGSIYLTVGMDGVDGAETKFYQAIKVPK